MTARVRTAAISEAPLPGWDGVLPTWPGEHTAGGTFVRRAPGPADGEPALMVHGLGGSSTNWTDLMGLLAGHLRSEAIDLPGFGRSAPATDYSLRTHARAVVAHLERRAAADGPVHLFGNSLGGAVSVRVAARRPDLVRSLTLVSPAFPALRPTAVSDPRLPLLVVPGVAGLVQRALRRRTPEQRALAVLRLCVADPSTIAPERVREAVAEAERRAGLPHHDAAFTGSLRGLVAAYAAVGRGSAWRRAARVQAPTLVVWGHEDRLVSSDLAPKVAATVPDARLLVLPGVGHVAQMETPDVVARAFLGLREELLAGAGTGAATR